MASETTDLQLVEPPPPDKLMPSPLGWELWCALAIALLLVALLFAWLVYRSGKTKGKPENLRAQAYKEALAHLALCPTEDRTKAATECSIILRRYLVKVTGDRALYETHEEWVARRDSIESLGDDLKQQVEEFCSQLARWKYAPADHGDEPAAMMKQTRQLLDAINREGEA